MTGLASLYALLKAQHDADTIGPQNYQVPPGQSDQFGGDLIMRPREVRFRDPEQAGPAPPTGMGSLASMYGAKR